MAEGENGEVPQQDPLRRSVLKGIAVGAGLVTSGIAAELVGAAANEKSSSSMSRLLEPEIQKIPRLIPPQLESETIPTTNEHYRTPLAVIKSAVESYENAGGKPFYKKPEDYLTQVQAIKDFVATDVLNITDSQAHPKALSFGAITFDNFSVLYEADPGTSVREEAQKQIQTLQDPDAVSNDKNRFGPTNADVLLAKVYGDFFQRTRAYIDQLRGTKKASGEHLLTYFLDANKGDIVKSLWDTTLFLKMAARVDTSVLGQPEDFGYKTDASINKPTRKNAELVSDMFYDEFSSEIPLDWLIKTVSPHDTQLNTDDPHANAAWKDFMPVNRAGTPYHVFNLATWPAVMDPELVEELTTAYYNPVSNPHRTIAQQGRIKVQADMTAARQARNLRQLFEKYKRE